MKTRRRSLILAALAGLLLLAGIGIYRHIRPYESSSTATVSWRDGGTPLVARVIVVDADEKPVVGAYVNVDNDSGGNGATTDASGVAVVDLSEREVKGMEVNGQRLVNRPLASYIGTPNVSRGLVVHVKMKRPKQAG